MEAVLRPSDCRVLECNLLGLHFQGRNWVDLCTMEIFFNTTEGDETLTILLFGGLGWGGGYLTWSMLINVSGRAFNANFISLKT